MLWMITHELTQKWQWWGEE